MQANIKKLVQESHTKPILLFDGVCNLCNGSVQFIINRDPEGIFQFAALQSDVGQQLLKHFNLPEKELNSVVLIQNGQCYTHSDAPLQIAKKMGGWLRILTVFQPVPVVIRNIVYNWIARNRYRWFGRQESCMVPTPELRQRFLRT